MFSIIICSISLKRLETLQVNIVKTIGTSCEFIAIDNSQKRWPIAKVYNYGAKRAKYPYLFFVHEDVKFHSSQWGGRIIEKLKEVDCGVIGFAGSKIRINCFAGWCQGEEYNVSSLLQGLPGGDIELRLINANHLFEEVVTLDGLGLFVRKDVWEKHPFDEKLLTDFHCYDIDFTLQIALAGFRNYVCCSDKVRVEHFSLGNFNGQWFSTTMRWHKKWEKFLPIYASDVLLDREKIKCYEEDFSYDFLRRIFLSDASRADLWLALKEFWKRPVSKRHMQHCIFYTWKYLFQMKY